MTRKAPDRGPDDSCRGVLLSTIDVKTVRLRQPVRLSKVADLLSSLR